MKITSVLVEYENLAENATYATSGVSINGNFVITTANLFAALLKKDWHLNDVASNERHSFIRPTELLKRVPEVNVITHIEDDRIYRRNGFVLRAFMSNSIRDVAGRSLRDWSIDSDDSLSDKELLSLFFIISIKRDADESLEDFKNNLTVHCRDNNTADFNVGEEIIACCTPFGNRHFFNTISRGIVSNLINGRESLVLTDCPTTVGCEGGLIFNYAEKKPVGMVLASVSWCKNEWVGLTLITNLRALFAEMLGRSADLEARSLGGSFYENASKCIVRIVCGCTWGSGVLLNKEKGIFITNAHVVQSSNDCTIRFKDSSFKAKVIFKTDEANSYDLAMLKANPCPLASFEMEAANLSNETVQIGDVIYAIGHMLFAGDLSKNPTITKGHVAKSTSSMLRSTSSVLGGSSGGGLFNSNGELIGIIVANVRLEEQNVIYPRFNIAIPIRAISQIIQDYLTTGDARILERLHTVNKAHEKEWSLTYSKL